MRTPIAMGLLVLALIPLAAEHTLHTSEAVAEISAPAISETAMKETVQSILFTAQRNREIDVSMARVAMEREARFVAEQNRLADASIAQARAYRERYFIAQRNAEIEAALSAVEDRRTREFVVARNNEIDLAMARHAAVHDELFAQARNSEIDAAYARRIAAFAADRNAEIERASYAAAARRQYVAALLSGGVALETGSLPHACQPAARP